MTDILFNEIALIIVLAGVLSFIMHLLRQPLIVAYILTGLIVGPGVLGVAQSTEALETFSQIGIAFLLFLVGINLNWRNVKEVGGVSLFAGIGQVAFTSLIGYAFARLFGFESVEAWFISVGFAFSSTIIIVKLLSDKQDLDRLYGRISVGTLIVQDLLAMLVLIVLAALRDGGGDLGDVLLSSLLKGGAVVVALLLLTQFVVQPLFSIAARQQELLFVLAISWCLIVSAGSYYLGFGLEIGALLAGMALAGSPYHTEVEHKVRPLRDFFLILFFIVLGTHLDTNISSSEIWHAIAFSAFILIGNPLILQAVLRVFGFHPRTGFLVGVTMAQISEFSFIVLGAGMAIGLIDDSLMAMSTIVGMITIVLSTYLINYNEQIYSKIGWMFRWMETKTEDKEILDIKKHDIILIGFEELGNSILPGIKSLNKSYAVVDFNPSVIQELSSEEVNVIYGDAGNEDFMDLHNFEKARLLISTVPDKAMTSSILKYMKKSRSRSAVVVTAKSQKQADEYYKMGATFVIIPSQLGGELFNDLLKEKQLRKTSWNTLGKKMILDQAKA